MNQINLFLSSIRSEYTKKMYECSLKQYGYEKLQIQEPRLVEKQIIDYIIFLKPQGKSYSVIHNYVSAIKAYYQINDVVLNVRKIGKFMPEYRKVKKDRAYTHEEISRLLEISDERMRAIVLLLGHDIGLASAYYRPTVEEMYAEYEKAIDNLTIDPANRLQRKIETLTIEKSSLDRIEEKMLKMEKMYRK